MLKQVGATRKVRDLVTGRDGTDTLRNIECIRFADGLLPLAESPGTDGSTPHGDDASAGED
ncbi:MAG: hypothetical protein VX727_06215 [Planctomycetota bacterium]|nr:hypothetical protein [Planctomycetota bacterium]